MRDNSLGGGGEGGGRQESGYTLQVNPPSLFENHHFEYLNKILYEL